MRLRVAIRGFAGRVRVFEEVVDAAESELDSLLPSLARKHAEVLASSPMHMIEIEFLDEPDPNERFLRFGTDPWGMVMPLQVNLS
jgi:hypothetical protein